MEIKVRGGSWIVSKRWDHVEGPPMGCAPFAFHVLILAYPVIISGNVLSEAGWFSSLIFHC